MTWNQPRRPNLAPPPWEAWHTENCPNKEDRRFTIGNEDNVPVCRDHHWLYNDERFTVRAGETCKRAYLRLFGREPDVEPAQNS